jgi:drug/metabolite transporter (DMT)-like permease
VKFLPSLWLFRLPSVSLIGSEWVEVHITSWLLIIVAASAVTVATLLGIVAMRTGDISFVSPFRYTSLIGALGLGVLFFGEWPDGVTLLGASIIVFSGFYSLHREHILSASK